MFNACPSKPNNNSSISIVDNLLRFCEITTSQTNNKKESLDTNIEIIEMIKNGVLPPIDVTSSEG